MIAASSRIMRSGGLAVPRCASALLWLACAAGCSSPKGSFDDGSSGMAGEGASQEGRAGAANDGQSGQSSGSSGTNAGQGGASAGGGANADRAQVGEPEVVPEDCDLSPLETWRAMDNSDAPM